MSPSERAWPLPPATFRLEEALRVLARTPGALQALLRGVGPPWDRSSGDPGTWAPYDVVGHLIHGERTDWIPRARIILEHGESQAFEPFDRIAQFEASGGRPLDALLDELAALRTDNLQILRGWRLGPTDLDRRGMHPELGTVTLGALLGTWVVHDLSHVAQIARGMGGVYRDDVGPWKAYLPMLHR